MAKLSLCPTALTSALPHAPLALTPMRILPGEAQNLLKTLGRVEGLLSLGPSLEEFKARLDGSWSSLI